jgi:hypothetical protein
MLIETAIPFTFFQHPAVERFLHVLNPAWKAPCPKIFATKLLDDVYQSTKQEVEQILAKEDHLSICFNGSDGVSKHRIINISANTSKALSTSRISTQVLRQSTLSSQPVLWSRKCLF